MQFSRNKEAFHGNLQDEKTEHLVQPAAIGSLTCLSNHWCQNILETKRCYIQQMIPFLILGRCGNVYLKHILSTSSGLNFRYNELSKFLRLS